MRVAIYRASTLPPGVLVWADPGPDGASVYVAASLVRDGKLTAAGRRCIEQVLPCRTPPDPSGW
ncbi:hypothetical protein [Streptomyces sp. BH055]|uniref:hypothetical protein n=1 Tax=Streptomyces sp. BH055 TaxID=3401173 RepID=UPI003BB711C1